jgi:molybdopterin-guanine dinucleotide biosynthesis protein A
MQEPRCAMKDYNEVEAFILAGGLSSRMGWDKGLLGFQGLPLIVQTARLADSLVRKVTVVGSPERYAALGLHTIIDQDFGIPNPEGTPAGPLAGIASALCTTQTPWNLILACDLPYLTTAWLDWLLARATDSDAQILLPRTSRGLEPLAAVYRRECAAPIVAELKSGVRKVTDALGRLGVEEVSEREWRHLDPDGRVLKNMNTRTDYEEAQTWWTSRGIPNGTQQGGAWLLRSPRLQLRDETADSWELHSTSGHSERGGDARRRRKAGELDTIHGFRCR